MDTTIAPDALDAAVLTLIQRAIDLAEDHGADVMRAVSEAAEQQLDEPTATRLFTRILTILKTGEDGTAPPDAASEIEAEVRRLTAAPRVPPPTQAGLQDPDADQVAAVLANGAIKMVEWNGLKPHQVRPIPTFHGKHINMVEGYVDITTVDLWGANDRADLNVQEFEELNGRPPEQMELFALMTGQLRLPSLPKKDPFKISELAQSIARKGVERPIILTAEGILGDGNRRATAAKEVVASPQFSPDEKDRARFVRAWITPPGITEDEFDAIVVALNFEDDLKIAWPEYVKARRVVDDYRLRRSGLGGRFTQKHDSEIKKAVASRFAITVPRVTRYLKMVQWADDFRDYHLEEGRDSAAVRYKTDEIFQWFYEIDAGKGEHKLTERLDQDDALKEVVYDLMFDVLDSGLQVRQMHKVIADEPARNLLMQAHQTAATSPDQALSLVTEAISQAQKNGPSQKIGFEQHLRTIVQRLGAASIDQWQDVDADLLKDLWRVLNGARGPVEGELKLRGVNVSAL